MAFKDREVLMQGANCVQLSPVSSTYIAYLAGSSGQELQDETYVELCDHLSITFRI